MSTMDEYLQTLFEKAFEREVAQEERVFSSLSFFVAALALTVNILGYIVTKLPDFSLSPYNAAVYFLMLIAILIMVGVMASVFNGVRQRVYRIPPKETDFLQWADGLRAYYSGTGLTGEALDEAVVSDLRQEMIREFSASVVHNRAQNTARTLARTNGISLMVVQLALAFMIVAIIFVHDRFDSHPPAASAPHGLTAPASKPPATQPAAGIGGKAPATQAPISCGGGSYPIC